MALLPTSPGILLSSEATPVTANLVDRDDAGGHHQRSLFAGQSLAFIRRYDYITAAEETTLKTFYNDNRTVTFTQTWKDGVTYTCVWTGAGYFFDKRIDDFWFGYMTMATSAPV